MSRRLIPFALGAAILTAVLSGCGPVTINPSSPPSAPASSGPASGNPPTASAGPTVAPVTYPNSAQSYATEAVAAWAGADSSRLGQLNAASDPVFNTLNGGNYNKVFTVYMCEGAAGSSYCTFYNAVGDTLILQLRNDLVGQAHAIIGGTFTPITFPTNLQAYAQEALNAWLGHNTAAVALLTGKPGDSAFGGVPATARTQNWTFGSEQGAAGHLYEVFNNSAGDEIAIGFINPSIVSPPANHHGQIENIVFSPHS